MAALANRHRYFPARALRQGSDDEATPYMEDIARFAIEGRWTSREGRVDYLAGLASITCPTLSLTSDGDRLYCRPASAAAFLATVPSCTHHNVTRGDDGGPPPGHMGLVTSADSRKCWRYALGWLAETSRRRE
jgi:pimeloyl-ACP methyl ester carboxylesterase